MNYTSVAGFLGLLLTYVALAMLFPAAVSWYYGDGGTIAFVAASGLTLAVGLILRWRCKVTALTRRDAFAITTLGWLATALFGALPFWLSGVIPSFVDAFFEAVSGVTTTGATVIADIESVPHGLLLWRSLLQWLGGMGIVVLTIAVLPQLSVGGMELFKAEVPSPIPERLSPRLRETSIIMWRIYIAITIVLAALLTLSGMGLFEAVLHALVTVPTGGFSTRATSIQAFDNGLIELILAFFMLLCGTNFSLIHKAVSTRSLRCIVRDPEFRVYLGIVVVGTLMITASLWNLADYGPWGALRHAAFQTISIVTTTGFATTDFALWPPLASLVIVLLMFVGGSAGSTAGGVKVLRHMVVVKHSYRELLKLVHPRAVRPVRIGTRPISEVVIAGVLGFVIIYMLLFGLGTLAIAAYGVDLKTAASAVAGSLGNVGPGLGNVGPMGTYAAFAPTAKLVLAFLMLIGRLEIYTVLVLLLPAAWERARRAPEVRHSHHAK